MRNRKHNTLQVNQRIGARLRARRLMIGLSQQELSLKLGISYQQLQKYEKGSNRITAELLMVLAEELETDVSDILYGGDVPLRKKDERNKMLGQIFHDLRQLPGKKLVIFSKIAGCLLEEQKGRGHA